MSTEQWQLMRKFMFAVCAALKNNRDGDTLAISELLDLEFTAEASKCKASDKWVKENA